MAKNCIIWDRSYGRVRHENLGALLLYVKKGFSDPNN